MKYLTLAATGLAFALAACDSAPALPQPDDTLVGGLPPAEQLADDKAAQAILDEYAKRFREGYPLYPGDVVRITVLGHPDLSLSAKVPSEGHISFPLVGKLALAGHTATEVHDDLRLRLGRDYVVNPDVTVLIEQYSKKQIYVLGGVKLPQSYELPDGRMITLLQALAQAGGFAEDADKNQVLIFRSKSVGSAERVTIPVNAVRLTMPGVGSDPLLIPDDIIFIPTREKVFVLGQVQKPGAYAVAADHPTTVTQAITMAGGLTRISAESSVRLIRRQKDGTRVAYAINVGRVLSGHPEDDAPVQPGDVIFVPESFF